MANAKILSLPEEYPGLTPASGSTAWTYGSYVVARVSTLQGIYVTGISLGIQTNPAAADATNEILIEIATGASSSESVKLQIPFNYRADTITSAGNGLGYWMPQVFNAYLPEPYFIPSGTRLSVRATDQKAGAVTYKVKILYREGNSPTTDLNSPADSSSGTDTTPTLTFTGTDVESNDIEYNVQVDTVNTFDSQGALSLLDSYDFSNRSTDDSPGNTYPYVGQTFDAGSGGVIDSVHLWMKKTAGITGSGYVYIYDHAGTWGSTGVPTGTPLAKSNAFDVSTLTTDYQEITFSFSGAQKIALNASTKYCFVYRGPTTAGVETLLAMDGSSPTHAGNEFYGNTNPSWTARSTNDFCFKVYIENTGSSVINAFSETPDAGFSGDPDNTHPFTSGQAVSYTVQSALSATTYYWRVRSNDPSDSDTWGDWSSTRSFTITSGPSSNTTIDLRITGKNTSNTTRDLRITGRDTSTTNRDIRVTGRATDSRSQDLRITGYLPTSSDTRDIRITGRDTSTASRDLRITGKNTSNNSRDLRITGRDFSNTTRDMRLTGRDTSSKAQDVRITGRDTSNGSRDVRVTGRDYSSKAQEIRLTGKDTSSVSRDIRLTGRVLTSDSRDIRITGIASTSEKTQEIRLIGQDTSSKAQDLRITGKDSSSTTRDVRITGKVDSSVSRDIRLTGRDSSSKDQDIRLTGRATSSDSRDLRLIGRDLSSKTQDVRITGKDTSSTSRDVRIIGRVLTSDRRDIRITGIASTSEKIQDIRITGRDTSSRTQDIRLTGRDTSNRSQDIRISGKDTSSVNRDVRIIGKDSGSKTQDLRVTGKDTSSKTQDIKLIGRDTGNRTQDIRLTGTSTSTVVREIRITGKQSSNDSRDLRIIGKDSSFKTQDIRLSGKDYANRTQDIRLIGQDTSSVSRDIRIVGKETSNVSVDLRITGKVNYSNTTQDIKLIGQAFSYKTQEIRMTGKDSSSNSQDIRITGSLSSSDSRVLKIVGVDTSNTTRDIKLIGGGYPSNTSRGICIVGTFRWIDKPKNSGSTSTFKEKILNEFRHDRILTPDGSQILVGENENLVLIYHSAIDLWESVNQKIIDTSTLKTKIYTDTSGRILTPDGSQILVGVSEDLVLIYQEGENIWRSVGQKTVDEWSRKIKILLD